MRDDIFVRTKSRYRNTPMVVANGTAHYIQREKIDNSPREDDQFYTIKDGDRIDMIAYKLLGDARHWWVICDYNSIAFPLELEVGKRLRVPSRRYFELEILG